VDEKQDLCLVKEVYFTTPSDMIRQQPIAMPVNMDCAGTQEYLVNYDNAFAKEKLLYENPVNSLCYRNKYLFKILLSLAYQITLKVSTQDVLIVAHFNCFLECLLNQKLLFGRLVLTTVQTGSLQRELSSSKNVGHREELSSKEDYLNFRNNLEKIVLISAPAPKHVKGVNRWIFFDVAKTMGLDFLRNAKWKLCLRSIFKELFPSTVVPPKKYILGKLEKDFITILEACKNRQEFISFVYSVSPNRIFERKEEQK
jgi:hypothetical protein